MYLTRPVPDTPVAPSCVCPPSGQPYCSHVPPSPWEAHAHPNNKISKAHHVHSSIFILSSVILIIQNLLPASFFFFLLLLLLPFFLFLLCSLGNVNLHFYSSCICDLVRKCWLPNITMLRSYTHLRKVYPSQTGLPISAKSTHLSKVYPSQNW